MDQYLNNRQNEILWKLLANPADNGHLYGYNLQQLTKDFPQSGLLQALLARANGGEDIHRAAASFDPKALYVMMRAYDDLAEVSEDQIVQHLGATVHYAGANDTNTQQENAHVLNDFSDGQLKDLLGFEPDTGVDETVDNKVVVGEDERHEVENLDLETPEYHGNTEPEQVTEFHEDSTEAVPETITEEDKAEEQHTIEQVTELPAEDHRVEMQNAAYEEEIIEFHEPGTELPVAQAEENAAAADEGHIISEVPAEDHRAELHNHIFEEEIIELPEPETKQHAEPVEENTSQDELAWEIPAEDYKAEIHSPVFEEEIIELHEDGEPAPVTDVSTVSKDIDDEVYDEIVGIDGISFVNTHKPVENIAWPETAEESVPDEIEAVDELHDTRDEIGELISAELAGSDYFVFEKAERIEPEPVVEERETFTPQNELELAPVNAETDTSDVSKYHDEKMPYTFMWWLDKTRKEHAGVYQPFKLDTTQAIRHTSDGTLQQQYYENIFHITTISELEQDAGQQTVAFDMHNKEDRIIKKFITEEPHISTPTGDKLDNENKAKRSAEDQDELVTETLARIYVDQMLYHKAINTYKKLILKFPEKSRYFADQIELLERKIN